MSNGHIAWNPYSSQSWAEMLGLVDVPLFNPIEQATSAATRPCCRTA